MTDLIVEVDMRGAPAGDVALAMSFAMETRVNLDFIARLNARVRDFYIEEGLRIATRRERDAIADFETVALLYDSIVGNFFELEYLERGSSKSGSRKKKRGGIKLFLGACAFLGSAVGTPIIAESKAGRYLIDSGVHYVDLTTDRIVQFAEQVAQDMPFNIEIETGGVPTIRIGL